MKSWIAIAFAALAFASVSAQAQEQFVHLTATGEVAHPGEVIFRGAPRLADVVKAVQVNRDAYIIGAVWLRPTLQADQARLKAGLVFDLHMIERSSDSRGRESISDIARKLRTWIENMPVTGRQMVRTLEPHALQVSPADNLPVLEGDGLFYPSRPNAVHVVGAVEHACSLPHAGLRDVRGYLAQCVASHYADPDVVYVIEPDGVVSAIGIALWDRDPPMTVAPGAVLYVPFDHKAMTGIEDPAFNREMADFIATQTLPAVGAWP